MHKTVRQGDVMPVAVKQLPAGCVLEPNQERKIVLAWGEVTGHHHRIEDHVTQQPSPGAADEITDAAIARAQAKARLWRAPSGDRFLEVTETVTLRHEEHTAHALLPGMYKLPTQVEYTPEELRNVAD